MQTVTDWFRDQQGWKRESCSQCDGHGVTAQYSAYYGDFEGAEECPLCHGNGTIWRTPKCRYVLYPGGPFC